MERGSDSIVDLLNSDEPVTAKKKVLRSYLIEQIGSDERINKRTIAYGIAGLMATRFAAELPDDDPYAKVLGIAGQLELPDSVRDTQTETWSQFVDRIKRLP